MKQKIIFTALPNGIDPITKNLKLSVAISPQVALTAIATKLSDVPDMYNWPDLINTAKFVILINNVPFDSIKISPDADMSLWRNLFTKTVNVNAFVQEDKTNVPILSYPVKHIASYIKSVVELTGKNFVNDMPDASYYTINSLFTDISNYTLKPYEKRKGDQRPFELKDFVTDTGQGKKVKRLLNLRRFIPFNASADPQMDFAQICNFHGLYDVEPKSTFTQFEKPDFEFHDLISVITQYPKLMRRLGLVIDFEIPLTSSIPKITLPFIRVLPTELKFFTPTTLVCPGTAWQKAKGFYSASQNDSFHNKGHVKINTDDFTVFQIDTDGAALKLTSHVDALQIKKAKLMKYAANDQMDEAGIPAYNNEETPRREGLPSNRTAGIAIAKNGLAEYLNARLKRMKYLKLALSVKTGTPPSGVSSKNASYVLGTTLLYSDDVNIGYRMDVKMTDKAGTPDNWHSLHFHENNYSFTNSSGRKITINDIGLDEGFVQLSTSEDNNIKGPHMKLSEVVARWEGWSLAVPMPGLSLNEPQLGNTKEVEKNDADEADKYRTPNDVPFKLNVFPVISKGTLPRLRLGQNYAIKLRMVDMAGNSLAYDAEPENSAEAIVNVRYMRFEPADAPFLIYGNTVKDGESSEVMVIRSNEGQTVQQYEKDAAHKDSAHTSPYKEVCIRHVKPPRTTVGMSITHGMLDQAIGNGSTAISAVYNKIKNDKDPIIKKDKLHVDPVTKKDIIKFDPGAVSPVENGNRFSIPVEYLADPMAAGVSFFLSALDPNIKVSASEKEKYSKRCSFYFDDEVKTDADADKDFDYNTWMSPKTFRIILEEGDPFNFEWSNSEREMIISMPKGFMLKLNYACFWKPKDIIRLSGVLDMMSMHNLSNPLGQNIAKGKHWLFSPWRTLTLVHAVQQPVIKSETTPKSLPFINDVTTIRDFSEIDAAVSIDLEVHGASTGVVDIEADWHDWVDDVNDMAHNGFQAVHKSAKVFHFSAFYKTYHYVYGDFPDKGIISNSLKAISHHFNDTRHRWVDYKAIASTRYKEYFFNLINEQKDAFKITRESNLKKRVNVLSTTRPMAPQIAYVIPTFEWGKEIVGDTTYSGRGSGLRIYLKRPWYSSGQDEKLAVVLLSPKKIPDISNDDLMEHIFTTWGNDPTKSSPNKGGKIFPEKDVFVGVKTGDADNLYTEDNLSIAEFEAAQVNIVAYDVDYDAERQLYFADVMLNFGYSYFPFVRLSLAAYQQHSVRKGKKDCCLSKIVKAEYVQIPPPRVTSLKKNGNNITATISGTLPAINNPDYYMPRIEFVIEPADIPTSEGVIITIDSRPIGSYSYVLKNSDLHNFIFSHSHTFLLPAEYETKPYRVKIFEYEMIAFDPRRVDFFIKLIMPNFKKDRLVFADVYEVNL